MNSREQNPTEAPPDPRNLTFSQAQGYEEIPGPLKLEELPKEARIQIWNVFFTFIESSLENTASRPGRQHFVVGGIWEEIFKSIYIHIYHLPLDEWEPSFEIIKIDLRDYIETQPFNKVFDLIQFVMRRPECPFDFIGDMKETFAISQLAHAIDIGPPPTILPAVTQEEGNALLESLQTLREAGLSGGEEHLRKSALCINQGDWAGSIRESIHAVESVARIIDPQASQTLGPALTSIEKQGTLHPTLKNAFNKLYGYTSNEQGIRHALLNSDGAEVVWMRRSSCSARALPSPAICGANIRRIRAVEGKDRPTVAIETSK